MLTTEHGGFPVPHDTFYSFLSDCTTSTHFDTFEAPWISVIHTSVWRRSLSWGTLDFKFLLWNLDAWTFRAERRKTVLFIWRRVTWAEMNVPFQSSSCVNDHVKLERHVFPLNRVSLSTHVKHGHCNYVENGLIFFKSGIWGCDTETDFPRTFKSTKWYPTLVCSCCINQLWPARGAKT